MTQGEGTGWFLDVSLYRAALTVWLALVVVHGFWRARGEAAPDPIRPSGPIA